MPVPEITLLAESLRLAWLPGTLAC